MEMPSKVEVPRPTSSSKIRLRGVCEAKICAVSFISTIKVELPRCNASCAPMRVIILSTTPTMASCAGTKEPICAIITISAVCFKYTLLPPMFGPVISISCVFTPSMSKSLGTKEPAGSRDSTIGWRPPL